MRLSFAPLLLAFLLPACAPRLHGADTPRPEQALRLTKTVWEDTSLPDGWDPPRCRPDEAPWKGGGHLYCFVVEETATYRFTIAPSFRAWLQVQEREKKNPWYFDLGRVEATAGQERIVQVTLAPGTYQVLVGGARPRESGPYRLRAEKDAGMTAQIGQEMPALVDALRAKAGVIRPGERALGVYRSRAGGARTSCGLLNGDAVHRLRLDRPARVRLRAAAHFRPALEVRSLDSGRPFGCARADEAGHEAALVVDLPAGEHLVVLDSLHVQEHDRLMDNNGIITSPYVVDTEEVPR